ncbi:hypothetical protein FEE59_19470 [Herbaspirillum sp. RU 5E]|uniref:phosphorylase family protein n=1 Tax=Herbaspirillum huttiense TaxID=863372 RepID=UPI000429DEFB|nr:hypothetical protein [Herbaspirillum huttiense]MBW9335696.1 hypothetical protein [Herbaspirillum sp. RU 5E]
MTTAPLSVLLVEDTPAKKRKLFERMRASPDIFSDPDVVGCTADAIKRLQEKQYDLMVLDIAVPHRADGDPNEQNSIDLLAAIDEGIGNIKRPRHVLPISADEQSEKVSEFFKGRPWGCIHYREDSDEALDIIVKIAQWIHRKVSDEATISKCDIFILTALEEPEFTAVEAAFPELGHFEPLDATQLVRYGEIACDGNKISVALGFAQRMGPVASAVLCTKAIELLKPKLILMAGICAAVGDKANIGDLVVADASWDWQSGKYVDKGSADFELAPHQLNVPAKVHALLLKVKRDSGFWMSFNKDVIDLKIDVPKLVRGPVATGASVIADERVIKKIREDQNKNVVGLDMETYAVYAACASAGYNVGALSLKAVCDKANKEKDDRYQPFAAKVSAQSVKHLVSNYGNELLACWGR